MASGYVCVDITYLYGIEFMKNNFYASNKLSIHYFQEDVTINAHTDVILALLIANTLINICLMHV